MTRSTATAPREAIASAAGRLFLSHGFAGTSIRHVAADAGVDPALVMRHFGSKQRLLLETLDLAATFDGLAEAPLGELGAQLVSALVGEGREERLRAYRAMVRASDSDEVRARLLEVLSRALVDPIAARLEGPDPDLRARLIAAQVQGLLNACAVVSDPGVSGADPESLALLFGAAIQVLVTPTADC